MIFRTVRRPGRIYSSWKEHLVSLFTPIIVTWVPFDSEKATPPVMIRYRQRAQGAARFLRIVRPHDQ